MDEICRLELVEAIHIDRAPVAAPSALAEAQCIVLVIDPLDGAIDPAVAKSGVQGFLVREYMMGTAVLGNRDPQRRAESMMFV
jgi:hypothetical protein